MVKPSGHILCGIRSRVNQIWSFLDTDTFLILRDFFFSYLASVLLLCLLMISLHSFMKIPLSLEVQSPPEGGGLTRLSFTYLFILIISDLILMGFIQLL